jgi:hypothetical protein
MYLVNLLRDDDDIDGLRAAYQAGTEQHNPDALYALKSSRPAPRATGRHPGRARGVAAGHRRRLGARPAQCASSSEPIPARRRSGGTWRMTLASVTFSWTGSRSR